MDKGKDEAINKLIAGQGKMEKDISGIKVEMSVMKEDISDLKAGQKKLEADVSELKQGQKKLETDFSELKQGQQNLETMMLKMIEEMTFVKNVVINMENDFKLQVKALFDANQSRQYETSELKHICREQEEKLNDHELRISRLEKD